MTGIKETARLILDFGPIVIGRWLFVQKEKNGPAEVYRDFCTGVINETTIQGIGKKPL